MSKKKMLAAGILAVCLIVLNVLIWQRTSPNGEMLELQAEIESVQMTEMRLYYGVNEAFTQECSVPVIYGDVGNVQKLCFSFPSESTFLRLDFGEGLGTYLVRSLTLNYDNQTWEIPTELLTGSDNLQQMTLEETEEGLEAVSSGTDPYVVFEVGGTSLQEAAREHQKRMDLIQNIFLLLVLDAGALLAVLFRRKLTGLPLELWQNRSLIWKLSVNDFKTKYAGSYLGIVWAFIQPIVTILVYWFVFSVGLKAGRVSEYPFVLYLVSGIVPWFFFQDALNGGTNALIEYNYLVKKVVFKISILPIVKIFSALFVHVFFVVFSLVICALYGYLPGLQTIQIVYYSGCVFLFTLGLVYATSAIVIFFRDLTQIINIVLQVGIWMTPIMWDLSMLDAYPLLQSLFKLNPMYYIVSGYRDAMLGKVWLVEHWKWGVYFWAVTGVLFLFGALIFKRLKPHFADVL